MALEVGLGLLVKEALVGESVLTLVVEGLLALASIKL